MVRQPKPGDSLPFHSPWIFEEEQRAGRAVQDDGLRPAAQAVADYSWGLHLAGTPNEQEAIALIEALRARLRAAPPLHDPQEPERGA